MIRKIMRLSWWIFARLLKRVALYKEEYMFWEKDQLVVITQKRWEDLKYIEELSRNADLSLLKLESTEDLTEGKEGRNFRPKR